MHDPCRRLVLRRALQLSIAVAPRLAPATPAASCVDPQSESLRRSLHYSSPAPVQDQNCGACGFFTRNESQAGCGNCVIMSGPVDATGHCDSWSARS
jgi:hypothetical protein